VFKNTGVYPCLGPARYCDVISNSVLARERGEHAGIELEIYTKLKWYKTNPCHYLYTVTMVLALDLFSLTYPTPCLSLASFESINANNDVSIKQISAVINY